MWCYKPWVLWSRQLNQYPFPSGDLSWMTRWAHRAGTGGSKILPFGNWAKLNPIIDVNKINTFIFLSVALTKIIIMPRDKINYLLRGKLNINWQKMKLNTLIYRGEEFTTSLMEARRRCRGSLYLSFLVESIKVYKYTLHMNMWWETTKEWGKRRTIKQKQHIGEKFTQLSQWASVARRKRKQKFQFSHDHFNDDDTVASSSSSFAFNSAPIVLLFLFYVMYVYAKYQQ